MLEKVVFLDRDGVINRDSPDYIKTWEEFEFLPGSLDAIALLTRNGFTILIITNQSPIGRGMIEPETLSRTHRLMSDMIAAHGGKIEDIFFLPAHTRREVQVPKTCAGTHFQSPGQVRNRPFRYIFRG